MKPKKLILTLTVLSIAVLALAACDATGAVPLSDLVGENAANNSTNDQSPEDSAVKSTSKLEDSQDGSPTEEPSDSIKLTGMVEAVTENSITINGTTFVVDSPVDLTTLFEVGMAYQFEYYLNADGSITVDSFSLDDGTSDDMMDGELKFQGMLEDVTETTLTFDGVTYTVDTQEDLTTLFVAGQMYEIEYYLNADGSITLKDFSLEDMSSGSSDEGYTGSNDDSYDDNSSNDSYNNNSDDDSYDDNSSNDSYDNNSDDSYDDSSNDSSNNSEDDSNNENNHENDSENNSENNG